MHAIAFDQRGAQAVGVFVQVFQRHRFGANVATAQDIGFMPSYADDLCTLYFDFQTTAGLAQWANTVVRGGIGHVRNLLFQSKHAQHLLGLFLHLLHVCAHHTLLHELGPSFWSEVGRLLAHIGLQIGEGLHVFL